MCWKIPWCITQYGPKPIKCTYQARVKKAKSTFDLRYRKLEKYISLRKECNICVVDGTHDVLAEFNDEKCVGVT